MVHEIDQLDPVQPFAQCQQIQINHLQGLHLLAAVGGFDQALNGIPQRRREVVLFERGGP